MSVLLLNATYEPLAVVSWKRAITLVLTGRAEMVEQDGDAVVRSAGGMEFPRPNVVRLKQMVRYAAMRSSRTPKFSKAGLTVRDGRECQVSGCDRRGSTVDHLLPTSRGGDTSWENCVLMCPEHNSRKGDRTMQQLGWTLKRRPAAPTMAVVVSPPRRAEWAHWFPPTPA